MQSKAKIYLLMLLLFFLSSDFMYAQERIQDILTSRGTYQQIVSKADAFFAQKYPNRTPAELAKGEYRDGNFVKYQRWKHYWKDKLTPEGYLGDPSAFFRTGRPQDRSLGLYCDMQWSNAGLPRNLGSQIGVGRTTSVAFHPTDINTFWVSTAIGGIWKTTDGGNSYIPIGDQLPTLAVSVVVVDQSNPDIIYAASGDRVWYGQSSIGVYKSIDGGENWTETSLTWAFSNQDQIYAMVADPSDPSTIYVCANNGLFRTTDGFETYEVINNGRATDLKFKPDDPSVIYYVAANQFFRSIDGGESFQSMLFNPSSSFTRITVSPADPERVYFSAGNDLRQSYDSGETFPETKSISDLDNGAFGYVIMSPQNPDVLYGGYVYTRKSIDNGANWEQITCFGNALDVHVDNHFAAFNPLDLSTLYFCNDGGIYKFPENDCMDCGSCFWEYIDLSSGMRISQYYDISNSQQQYNVIGGGTQDNGSFFRRKTGEWTPYAPTGDGMVSAIDPQDDTYRYWEYQFGQINRYESGNNTCISCTIPNDEGGNGAWVTPYELHPSDPSMITAAFSRIYRSFDRGNTWVTLSDQLANGNDMDELAVAPSNPDVIYVNDFNTIYKTTNASEQQNAVWQSLSAPTSNVTSIAVDPNDENIVYITQGGYQEGAKVFRSDNGGEDWTNVSGSLPNVPANVIKFLADENYDRALFVGTDAGVYYIDDNLEDWEEYGSLPHTEVSDIEFQYSNQLIRIGTHGRSVFEAPLPLNPCLASDPPDSDGDGVCDAFDACPEGDDFEDLDEDGLPDACEEYCLGAGAAGTGSDWIESVVLNTLDNVSNQTFYSDFTNLSTDLVQGETYEIEVGLNFSFDLDIAYAWIDFNQNIEFDEEELITFSDFDLNHVSKATFEVPLDARLGETRMRVRNVYTSSSIATPCFSIFGEVEDYTINILQGTTNVPTIEEKAVQLELMPNPTNGELQIWMEHPSSTSLPFELLNAKGQVLLSGRLAQGTANHFDWNHLDSGVYWVRVKTATSTQSLRFVVL